MPTVQEIALILSNSLSTDANTRIASELELAAKFADPGASLVN